MGQGSSPGHPLSSVIWSEPNNITLETDHPVSKGWTDSDKSRDFGQK